MPCYPAGEAGYLLLAANFERFRQKSRAELSSQDQVGRVKAVRGLLPFIDAFEPLQASVVEDAPEFKIHSFYAGVYKQFNTLLESWEVRQQRQNPPRGSSAFTRALTARARRTRAPHALPAPPPPTPPSDGRPPCAHASCRVPRASCLIPRAVQVESYEAVVGEKLDFSRHVAVSRSESDEPAGTILEARTKGYTLAGAVVRSAECIASLGPDEPEPAAPTAEEAAAEEAEETRDEADATDAAEK